MKIAVFFPAENFHPEFREEFNVLFTPLQAKNTCIQNLTGKIGDDNPILWHSPYPDLQDTGNKAFDFIFFLFCASPV